jgi:hypothetical protein
MMMQIVCAIHPMTMAAAVDVFVRCAGHGVTLLLCR